MAGKAGKYLFLFVLVLVIINIIFDKLPSTPKITFGVSFSPSYAKYLKLDWQKVYLQALDELGVKHIRVPAYWEVIEQKPQQYDFSQTDFMMNESGKRGVKVVLVVGLKQPRWPECHMPAWAKNLTQSQRQQSLLVLIRKLVERYKDHPALGVWQVENEPLVAWFGENCDPPSEKFLSEEINLVKSLDNQNKVMVTESGEWSSWAGAMKYSDVLGISMYRKAYNSVLSQYITYPFPFWMYPAKSSLVRKLFAPNNQKTIISELQTEPWFEESAIDTPIDKQKQLFSIKDFKGNIEYAKKTGFDEQYLWGVEWWYYMSAQGYPEYLEYAKTLFR